MYGALTMIIVWKAIEELQGSLLALILGSTCVLFSALLRLNLLYQPNSFDVLCWTAIYFVFIKYINTNNIKWLFIGSIIFAFGFLNKYNVVFLLLGFLPALLLTKNRSLFLKPTLYLAFLLGFILILPNLIWQFNNNFPVIYHLKLLAQFQLVNVNRFDFLMGQVIFFSGSLIVILASFYALLFYKPFKNYRVFIFSILFTLILFLYFRAKDYYAIGIYPIYIAFGSVYIAEILKEGRKKYFQPIVIAFPILLFIPIYKVAFPIRTPEYIIQHSEHYKKLGMLRWEDGKDHLIPQDFADMLAWKELAIKVDSIYKKLPNKGNTLILCDNYGQAGAINYYSKLNIKAVSFHADYINWFEPTKKYLHLIRVKEMKDSKVEMQETGPFFQKGILVDSITNQYAREYGTSIFVFTFAKIDLRERIKEEVEEIISHR